MLDPIKTTRFWAAIAIAGFAGQIASGQAGLPEGDSYGGSVPGSEKVVPGIAWYGVLEDGFKEAERTGKPILFITAAAQCNGVPGLW